MIAVRSKIAMILTFLLTLMTVSGQRLLLLEVKNEIKSVRFAEGSQITYETADERGQWKTGVIERIVPDQNMLVTEHGIVYITDITRFRTDNNTARAIGYLFQGFGTGWLVFGGLALITGQDSVKPGHLIIGVIAMGIGWLFKKVASKRTYTIGKNANLRIIDINFTPLDKGIP